MVLHRKHAAKRSDRMIRLSAALIGTVAHKAPRLVLQPNVRCRTERDVGCAYSALVPNAIERIAPRSPYTSE
jgi:hypothetical protein